MLWECVEGNVSETTAAQWSDMLRKFIPYITVGGFTMFGNILVIAAIIKHKSLHSKYFLMAALAGGDFCQGAGYFSAGCMRLVTVAWGTHELFVTTFDCMCRPYNIFFIMGIQLPIIVTCLISIERLLAVSFPLRYNQWPVKQYMTYAVIGIYGYCFAGLAAAFIDAATQTGRCVGNICYTEWAMSNTYGIYIYVVTVAAGFAAMFIYIGAMFSMVIKRKELEKSENSAALTQLKRQTRITKLMSVIVVTTFVFVILPSVSFMLGYILETEFDFFGAFVAYLGVTFCTNSAINVILYAVSNPELRAAFIRTILCQPAIDTFGSSVRPSGTAGH